MTHALGDVLPVPTGACEWAAGGEAPPSAPAREVRTSAVVFSWEEAASLRRLLPVLLRAPLDEIVVTYGGDDGSREFVEGLEDPRLIRLFEPRRDGKWRAFNRGIGWARGRVVLLASGDVHVEPEMLGRLCERLDGGAGVAFPRVVPSNVRGWVTKVGALLWELREVQFAEGRALGLTIHGGELQAVRRELLEPIPSTINEDALVCLRAAERGFAVVYAGDVVAKNTVPETLTEFLHQRSRINCGHFQLLARGYFPATLDTLLLRRPRTFLRMLWTSILARPKRLAWLPVLLMVEGASLLWGYVDHQRQVDHSRWRLVRSGKDRVAPAPGSETVRAAADPA